MPFAIELYLDHSSAQSVRDLWTALSRKGISSSLLNSGAKPHLTLGVYEYLDFAGVAADLAIFAKRMAPLDLTLSSFGAFTSAILEAIQQHPIDVHETDPLRLQQLPQPPGQAATELVVRGRRQRHHPETTPIDRRSQRRYHRRQMAGKLDPLTRDDRIHEGRLNQRGLFHSSRILEPVSIDPVSGLEKRLSQVRGLLHGLELGDQPRL